MENKYNHKKVLKVVLIVIFVLIMIIAYSFSNRTEHQKDKIKIGIILPLSGPMASLAEDTQKTFEMYSSESKMVEFVYQDDQCLTKNAVSAYNVLKNQGIKIYISLCSGSTLALAPIAKQDGNLILTNFSGSIDIRDTGDEVIRFIPDGLSIAEKIVEIAKENPDDKYYIFHQNQDYAKSISDFLSNSIKEQIVSTEAYNADNMSFKTQLLKIKNSGASKIILIPVSDVALKIIYKEMSELELSQNILGDVNVCDLKLPDPEFGIKGVCLKTQLKTDGYEKYLNKFIDLYGKAPTIPFYNAIGYDVVYVLDQILVKNKIKDTNDFSIRKIKEEILAGVNGFVSDYNFTDTGEVIFVGEYIEVFEF